MITASIVVYKTLPTELGNIIECSLRAPIQTIFVVDNSPTNSLQHFIEQYHSTKLHYIWGQGNVGYGAAHNIAIRQSFMLKARYHIVLNPDISFKDGTIESLTQFMDEHPDVGLIMPNVIYPDGSLQCLCKLLPTPMDIFARRFFPKSWVKRRNKSYEMHFMGYDKTWDCPNLSGCFMFMRNVFLEQTGGFDDRFFMYFEDTDLVRRLHRVCKTIFYPKVTIVHAHKAEHRKNYGLLKISIQSAMLYFNKYGWLFDRERRRVNRKAMGKESQVTD